MEENNKFNNYGRLLSGEDKNLQPESDFNEMKQIWDLAGSYSYKEEENTNAGWANLQSRLNTPAPMQVSWIRRNVWTVAASIALLAVSGTALWYFTKSAPEAEVAAIHEKTGNKQFKTLHLADGTTITMNANTEITVAAGFNSSNRNIELKGEASFEVAHNDKVPFLVTAGGTTTRVVGTGFDISAFAGENVKIQVLHGKVQFGNPDKTVMLTKGQAARFDQKDKTVTMAEPNATDLSWQNENWVFKSASLEEIATQIKHSLGKTLKYDAKYAGKVFTGKFAKSTPAEDIAKTLAEALQIPITVE